MSRVDDLCLSVHVCLSLYVGVLSGVIRVTRRCVRWPDVEADFGPPEMLNDGVVRWDRLGVVYRVLRHWRQRRQAGMDHDRCHVPQGATRRG